ncbi:MAG: hypothetical protein WBA54_00620 [Acidaminobacteraceae bacterium]
MDRHILPILGKLEDCDIDDLNIDFKNNSLMLTAKLAKFDSTDLDEYYLAFENISAFYFIDGTSEFYNSNKNTAHSIFYYDNGIGEFATIKDVDGEHTDDNILSISVPNFSISLENSSIFLETNQLNVNGDSFNFD